MKLLLFLIFHGLVTAFLIFLVIFQQSRGAEMGAAFGSGSTLLGPGGADKLAIKITTFTAIVFMISTIILVNLFSAEFKNKQQKISNQPISNLGSE